MAKVNTLNSLDLILNQKVEGLKLFDPLTYRLGIESRVITTNDLDSITLMRFEKQLLELYELYLSSTDKSNEKDKKQEILQNLVDLKYAMPVISDRFFSLKQVIINCIDILLSSKGYISKPKILKFLRLLITTIDYEVQKNLWGENNG